MRRILQQPLLWFLLIGGLLFAADALLSSDRSEIYVSAAQQQRLATLWTTQTGMTASAQELESLTRNWIAEEVLYREALRLGLDEEDSIIRRRLIQKLEFIAESDPTPAPDNAALQGYHQDHIEAYTLPTRYSFRQLYFQSAESALAALASIAAGAAAASLGEASMLNSNYAYRSVLELNAIFGAGFAERINDFTTDTWDGPAPSGFGFHLVQLAAIHPPEIRPFQSALEQVTSDYQALQQANARELYIERLTDQYQVIREPALTAETAVP